MDILDALAIQVEWGADEFLCAAPQDRQVATPPPRPARPAPPRTATAAAGPTEAERRAAACFTLEALRAALANFSGCALRETATNLVFGEGPAGGLLCIGDAPGAEEDRTGAPFVGPAGQLLTKMLSSINIARDSVRLTTILPWRPPGDRAPTESEIALLLPFLRRQIALAAPAALLLLGAVAAKALLPEPACRAGIRRQRGSWRQVTLDDRKIPALATYHPAYLLRAPAAKAEGWCDMLTLREHFSGFDQLDLTKS
jgi:DNA polymerase